MAKILFISARRLDRTQEPRGFTIKTLLGGLSTRHSVCLIALHADSTQIEGVKLWYAPDLTFLKFAFAIFRSIIFRMPLQYFLHGSKSELDVVDRVIVEERPDIIIFDYARSARLIESVVSQERNKDIKLILDMGDLVSRRYQQLASSDGHYGFSIGNLQHTIPNSLLSFVAPFQRKIFNYEAKKMAALEVRITKLVHKTVLVSQIDAVALSTHGGRNIEEISFIAADPPSNVRLLDGNAPVRGYIIGNYNYQPNLQALRLALEYLTAAKYNDYFGIVGPGDAGVPTAYGEYTFDLRREGFVDDLNNYLCSCTFLLCPIDTGTGINSKFLEALRSGVIVITNSKGALPLSHLALSRVIVVDNAYALPAAVEEAVRLRPDWSSFAADQKILDEFCSAEAVNTKWERMISAIL